MAASSYKAWTTSRSRASTSRSSPPAARRSGEWAPRFADAGAVVIDNSSRWRMHDDVPLVVTEVNPEALDDHRGIIANPNCSTMQMVVALKPLHDAAGIERLVISTYQAVSGTGRRAVDELLDQSHALLHEREIAAPERLRRTRSPSTSLPHAGSFAAGDDHTDEERKLMNETRKILGDPSIRVSAPPACACRSSTATPRPSTCRPREPLSPERARELLARRARRDRARRPRRGAVPAGDRRRRPATTCSSGASAATPATSARSTCGSSPTTCARAPRPTRCSSPSCCTSAGWCAYRARPRPPSPAR